MTELKAAVWPPYTFKNEALCAAALRHPSVVGKRKNGDEHFERLEFLGDRVVGLVVADLLLEHFPNAKEGDLARRHTALVRAGAMAEIATALGLERHLDTAGTKASVNVLADALEAYLGAVYLDGGLEAAAPIIRRWWGGARLDAAGADHRDPKSALQEWAQARALPLPVYTVVSQQGPAHAPLFEIMVQVGDVGFATASGSSRKQAEATAATLLYKQLETHK